MELYEAKHNNAKRFQDHFKSYNEQKRENMTEMPRMLGKSRDGYDPEKAREELAKKSYHGRLNAARIDMVKSMQKRDDQHCERHGYAMPQCKPHSTHQREIECAMATRHANSHTGWYGVRDYAKSTCANLQNDSFRNSDKLDPSKQVKETSPGMLPHPLVRPGYGHRPIFSTKPGGCNGKYCARDEITDPSYQADVSHYTFESHQKPSPANPWSFGGD